MPNRLIALDWGTSTLRAYHLDPAGNVIARLSEPLGILNIPDRDFDTVFETVLRPWLARGEAADGRDITIICSGMIGSRQGWLETPYAQCPATVAALAGDLRSLTSRGGFKLWLVPGVSYENPSGVPDVMRGEETQIVGAIDRLGGNKTQWFVLPGTHSKWVRVEAGAISQFATFMSGELFAVLCGHSILGRLMTGREHDVASFERGLDYARSESGGGQLQKLFSARTLGLFGQIPGSGLRDYLSGLIIGAEIAEGLLMSGQPGDADITLIGDAQLAALYRGALQRFGVDCAIAADDTVAIGLRRIAEHAGLIAAVDPEDHDHA